MMETTGKKGTYFLLCADGSRVEVEAKRFSHYVDGTQFWFLVHDSAMHADLVTVSAFESRKRATDLQYGDIFNSGGDRKKAAKAALDRLISKHGAAKVRSVLSAG